MIDEIIFTRLISNVYKPKAFKHISSSSFHYWNRLVNIKKLFRPLTEPYAQKAFKYCVLTSFHYWNKKQGTVPKSNF